MPEYFIAGAGCCDPVPYFFSSIRFFIQGFKTGNTLLQQDTRTIELFEAALVVSTANALPD